MRNRGLTQTQIICIALLWVGLCVMMFTMPSNYTLGEKIFSAVASGIIIFIGISKGKNLRNRDKRK